MMKGDLLTLTITDYAFEGKGISKIIKPGTEDITNADMNYVVFVNGAYPGDIVEAKLIKIKQQYAEAKAINIITPSDIRTKAECEYFGTCGGCKQQDMIYSSQTLYKEKQVKEIFERMGKFTDFEFCNIIPSKDIYFYRNKMEFSFSRKKWFTEIDKINFNDNHFALGLHIPRMFDKVLDINRCVLQSEFSNDILNFTRDFMLENNKDIFSTNDHLGYLRNLVIRQAGNTKDLMVNLVTSEENDELLKDYTKKLLAKCPAITTVINNISQKKSLIAVGDYEKVFFGEGYIYDYIGKYKFRISSNSFFQTNTKQAEHLYNCIPEFADFKNTPVVYDMYCGAGTISIFISELVQNVYGFETVSSSISDANINAKINNISNTHFTEFDLNKSLLPVLQEKNIPKPDIIIVDPPRNGMHPKTISDILELSPEKIVYVSCNPTTQVRDIQMLSEKYTLTKVKPVDMFAHTFHIENVALLIRK